MVSGFSVVNIGGNPGQFSIVGPNTGSLAEQVLNSNGISFVGTAGHSLPGYDVKSQDAISILKLSLQAQTDANAFCEVYCRPDGLASFVLNSDQDTTSETVGGTLLLTTETSEFRNKTDFVLVKGKDPLPYKHHGDTLNISEGQPTTSFEVDCGTAPTYNVKNVSLMLGSWVGVNDPEQEPTLQERMKNLVHRSQYQELLGYKVSFTNIPNNCSISFAQSTPASIGIPVSSSFQSSIEFRTAKDIMDIAGVVTVGAPVLHIMRGSDIFNTAVGPVITRLSGTTALSSQPALSLTDKDLYVLLDHRCTVNGLSAGENWTVTTEQIPLSEDLQTISVNIGRTGGGQTISYEAFGTIGDIATLESAGAIVPGIRRIRHIRRNGPYVSNFVDIITSNLTRFIRQDRLEDPNFSLSNATVEDFVSLPNLEGLFSGNFGHSALPGQLVAGLGGDFGYEVYNTILAYTVQKPSIQVKSVVPEAPIIGTSINNYGMQITAVVITDEPAHTAIASASGTTVRQPPAPPDDETEPFEAEDPLEELAGSIIEIGAPWLDSSQIGNYASNIYRMANETGRYKTYTYTEGGYGILPNMKVNGETVHTVDFSYGDRDSVTTNITTGPRYYPVGSYSESVYIKRSTSISRKARVISGDNSTGLFYVDVNGLGQYQAINGLLEPIFPGDRVEVNILNYPIEKE